MKTWTFDVAALAAVFCVAISNLNAQSAIRHVWPLQRTKIIPNGTYFLNWPQTEPATAAAS